MRTLTHIKETIACRKFEYALSSNFVSQSFDQGKDYGIDYNIKVFNAEGNCIRGFNAQVKYISNKNYIYPENHLYYPLIEYKLQRTKYNYPIHARHRISLSHIKDYLNKDISDNPTLYVLANEFDLFLFWVDDLFNYYLRWLNILNSQSKTVTIYANEIRSYYRYLDLGVGVNFLDPGHRDYWKGKESFLAHGSSVNDRDWISEWCVPGTVDSLSNIGLSIYLQNRLPETNILKNFDVNKFWKFILDESKSKPWIMVLFSKFIGLLEPNINMIRWAENIINEWNAPVNLPVAFQIISNSNEINLVKNIFAILKSKSKQHALYIPIWEILPIPFSYEDRIFIEFYIGTCEFMATLIKKFKFDQAQKLLINLFVQYDYSTNIENVFGIYLGKLANQKALIINQSYKELLSWCDIKNVKDQQYLSEIIHYKNIEWHIAQDSEK